MSTMGLHVLTLFLVLLSGDVFSKRPDTIFMNQFAVHVPSGEHAAQRIADTHGFNNLGQIGSLRGFYLFEHSRVHKRSLDPNTEHHSKLEAEPEVHWVQQQHAKRRVKRDFSAFGSDFPTLFGLDHSAPALSPGRAALSLHPTHRQQYRGAGPFFPDPLFKEQWYMNGGAKDGFDMNVWPAWQKGYTGKGVVVSILDDGIQTNHPDLAGNYDPQASTDINDNDDDPMPRDNGDNKHGTRCAGEVAAVAFNNFCGVGVAYNASIGGVRMLDGTVNDAVEARALGLNPNHVDIYSASWGPEDDGKTVDGPGPLARRAFIYGVTSGRKGKGSIFVWASGNGGRHTDSCNCDGYTNSIFTLSISSATQGGYKPWYLEECSSTLATTYSSGTPGHDKSVATVDMDGRLRPDHICTVEHTGTSASAPLAAGICALALEANPGLTWRDMQYLVVLTSRSGPLEKEPGWIVNGVKRKVSHKFGYGLMDAGAIVTLAEQWVSAPPQHICKSQEVNEDKPILANLGQTLQVQMDVDGCRDTYNEVRHLEHVQCKLTLRFFPRGNLRILITSPMGTTSTLLFERPRDVVSSSFDDWPFLSVHFWGEHAAGRWTLQIVNAGNRQVNQPGILKKWQLIFYGTAENPIRLKPGSQGLPGLNIQQPSRGIVFPSPGPDFYPGQTAFGGQGFSDVYASGSNPEPSVAPLDGSTMQPLAPSRAHENRVIHTNCDPECDSQGCYGKGPAECVACRNYKLDGVCVSRCPPRSFRSQSGVCWPCHESCETCAGAGQDSCLTCAPAHLRVTDLAVCLRQCPEGYFENIEQRTCVPCHPNCASCLDSSEHCVTCDHHLVLHENRCLAACPPRTYETDEYSCAPCHATCETCLGAGDTQCVSCRAGYFAQAGRCVSSCENGSYADKKRRECVRCQRGCVSCHSNLCSTCDIGWTLDSKSKCQPAHATQCSLSEFWSGGQCRACHATCESCDGPGESSCLSCPSPLLLAEQRCVGLCTQGSYMERGRCVPCPHSCRACTSRTNCTQCLEGLKLQSGECRATCADGYYSDRDECARCSLSCAACWGPRRDQCVACPEGWQLAAGECHPECPEGFFKADYGCQKCHHYCRTCKGEGPLQCTSCPPHFMLDGGLCMECLSTSQYYDPATQLCKACHSSCKGCSGPGQFACTGCLPPLLHLDKLNSQCVPCCPEGHTPGEQAECCVCHKDTGECQNASPAGKRRIAVGAEGGEGEGRSGSTLSDGPGSFGLSFHTVTALAVGGCITVVLLFGLIFAALQVNSVRETGWQGRGYQKLQLRRCKVAMESSSVNEDNDALLGSDADEEHEIFAKT